MAEQPQSRLILLAGELKIFREGGREDYLRVFIVDHRTTDYGGLCTVVLREPVPADVSWTGSRLPGAIVQAEAEDVVVDIAAAEAGLLP